VNMKRVLLVLVFGFGLGALSLAPAFGDASQQGCQSSGGKAAGCSNGSVTVPEPGTSVLLALGLIAVGGLTVFLRVKRLSRE
jgi:hypothetical protein